MTHSYVRHVSFSCVPWFIHMCAITHSLCAMIHSYVYHAPFKCVPWLIHICAMTHSYVCHDSFICLPWLLLMCAMRHTAAHTAPRVSSHDTPLLTHSSCLWSDPVGARHDCFLCVTLCLIHIFDTTHCAWSRYPRTSSAMTHSYVRYVSFSCVPWLIQWSRYPRTSTTRSAMPPKTLAPLLASRCVAVCCSALQCVAVCCSALQCVAVCCAIAGLEGYGSALQFIAVCCAVAGTEVCCNLLQYVAVFAVIVMPSRMPTRHCHTCMCVAHTCIHVRCNCNIMDKLIYTYKETYTRDQ